MKLAIVGSRNFPSDQVYKIRELVYSLPKDTVIVSGGAKGVDSWAVHFAVERGMETLVFLPDWKPNGVFDRSAGFKRNTQIVEAADEVVAFWDGQSKGTFNTIQQALRANKMVTVIEVNNALSKETK